MGGLMSLAGALVSQGPDGVRRLPELPEAVSTTVGKALEEREIRSRLQGVWEYLPNPDDGHRNPPVRLTIVFVGTGWEVAGEFFSPAVRKWTQYPSALIDGGRDGRFLKLRVYEFVGGESITQAILKVRFQEDPQEISDHIPELVLNELMVEVESEARPALAKEFLLRKLKG
jgi:hypothetical protein